MQVEVETALEGQGPFMMLLCTNPDFAHHCAKAALSLHGWSHDSSKAHLGPYISLSLFLLQT